VIRSVEIKGLRGIREGKLTDLSPLVVLVGPNGSGKSTVLEALLIGASPLPVEAAVQVVRRHEAGGTGPRWLLWRGGEDGQTEIRTGADPGVLRECKLLLDRSKPEGETLITLAVSDDSRGQGAGNLYATQNTLQSWRPTGFVPVGEIQEVRLIEGYPTAFQTPLYDVYSNAARQGRQPLAKDVMGEVLPGVRNIEILTESGRPVVYLVFDKYSVPATLCGDGILSLLQLTLQLTSAAGVMLLEEPEVHQHPGAMRRTARVILAAVRRDIQVILTTHSLELIDALVAESSQEELPRLSLYRLFLEDGTLTSSRLAGPDVAFARSEIEDDLR
jgi:predicted ATPase